MAEPTRAMTIKVELSPNGRAKCKKSKVKIERGEIRIGREVKNPFTDKEDATVMYYYKVEPFFQYQLRARKATRKAEALEDFEGIDELPEKDRAVVEAALKQYLEDKNKPKPKKKRAPKRKAADSPAGTPERTKRGKKGVRSKSEFVKGDSAADEGSADVAALFSNVKPDCPAREAVGELLRVATSLGFPVVERVDAKMRAAQTLMGNKIEGKFDFVSSLKALAEELECPEKVPGGKKKVKRPAPEAVCEDNQKIVEMFWELASFEFKRQKTMKGIAFQKASRGLAQIDWKITSGKEVSKKGPKKVDGVGKKAGAYIDEFLSAGTLERLEAYRRGEFD